VGLSHVTEITENPAPMRQNPNAKLESLSIGGSKAQETNILASRKDKELKDMAFIERRIFAPKPSARTLATTLFLIGIATQFALAQQIKQPWVAPASASRVQNPIKPSPTGLRHAEQLYQQDCMICHGKTGASNGPAAGSLPQKPANFTDAQMMSKATDGELFWKMTTGRAPMPSWQDRFSETERWELVNYLRELTKKGQYKYLGGTAGAKR
jgi:mono/diheme cytochrome c family protein